MLSKVYWISKYCVRFIQSSNGDFSLDKLKLEDSDIFIEVHIHFAKEP